MAENKQKEEGGFYSATIGKPLQIDQGHNLRELVEFSEKYGVDLPLHLSGRGMTVQITVPVVVLNSEND